jgi:hypothetical protein
MNKEEIKQKVKNFYEENKLIIGYIIGGGVAIIGSELGWRLMKRKYDKKGMEIVAIDKDIVKALADAESKKARHVYTRGGDIELTHHELGKLSERMSEMGVPDDVKFTHFIALGKK